MKRPLVRRTRIGIALAFTAASVMAVSGCGGGDDGGSGAGAGKQIDVVGYSIAKAAYDELSTKYAQTPAGEGFSSKGSYGASGAQSRAVIAGQPADFVVLSLTPDVNKIVDAGLIDASWNAGPTKGIVSNSVVVLAVRPGNPKGIKGWDDVVQPGIGIVTADPGTSGAAKWNLLGAYSHGLGETKDKAAGEEFLGKFVKNVVSWNDSGRTATEAFVKGTGDVLISYENEAILAQQSDVELDYVVPADSFLIENPGAVTKSAPPVAAEFLKYVLSNEGQAILGAKGFRPVGGAPAATDVQGANDPANPFPDVKLTTVADLGGWSEVNDYLFKEETGLVAKLRQG
jgi:sulfate/thiosulfate-binding protein